MKVTAEEIEAAKTPNGGWTREQLARWGRILAAPKRLKKGIGSGGHRMTDDQLREAMAATAPPPPSKSRIQWNRSKPRQPRIDHAAIVESSAQGMAPKAIAQRMACSPDYVCAIIRKARQEAAA